MSWRILVFPCGSEIGLEIHRSLRFSSHCELIGASSVDDHGIFVFERYIGGLPLHSAADFPEALVEVIREHSIDAIYPTMDAVAETLQELAPTLGVRVIGSNAVTTALCASKRATYERLQRLLPVPACYATPEAAARYPIFIKPDRGYGSRHAARADTPEAATALLQQTTGGEKLILEYLPGREWTIDCFSDRHGKLRYQAARARERISHGISVRTAPDPTFAKEFAHWAEQINAEFRPRGAWFFQAKANAQGQPRLLEVAARLGGSSGLFRCLGVNFALLSIFDAFDMEVEITPNECAIMLDRALDNRYRLDLDYKHVYVDLDDCLIIRGRLNLQLLALLFKAGQEGKRITLVTRHLNDPAAILAQLKLSSLFDEIIHITDGRPKSKHIDPEHAIFIDDSHRERTEVARTHHIPVFSPDMIEALL